MKRTSLALCSVSAIVAGVIACSSANPATPVAPTAAGASAAADGSTLKATSPGPQSPINDQRLTSTVVVLTTAESALQFASAAPLQYRFQVLNAGNAVVDQAVVNGTSWTVAAALLPNTRYTWRVRAEIQNEGGPWSALASFVTTEPFLLNDPLTNGTTVGRQIGGHFVAGQGWQSDGVNDGIDYDLETCTSCRLEFDATNFGKGEGAPYGKDLKWVTMGDAGAFGDFNSFRDHPWKMHLEQRADGNGTGMKLIWRNGRAGDREPGDHTGKLNSAVDWRSDQVFHFTLEWTPGGFTVAVNGEVWFQDGFGGNEFAPPNFRISLGCYPRGESFVGAIWRNVKLSKL